MSASYTIVAPTDSLDDTAVSNIPSTLTAGQTFTIQHTLSMPYGTLEDAAFIAGVKSLTLSLSFVVLLFS